MKQENILKYIGNTPILNIDGIFAKCEFLNPSGSIKDRVAKYFVERAETTGKLRKGYTIVEASTGNTGTSLSMVGAVKGYKVVIFIPKGLTKERYQMIKFFGAEVIFVKEGRMDLALEKAEELGRKPGYFHPNQFSNPWNEEEHEKFTGKEIILQLKGKKIDAIVTGIGTGGTLVGIARAFKKINPKLKVYGVEPLECAMTYEHMHNLPEICSPHRIEGIADGFVPRIIYRNISLIDGIVKIPSKDAVRESKKLAREHGCFVGVSSGANLLAAKQIKRKNPEIKNIVTLFPDAGEKYLSERWFCR